MLPLNSNFKLYLLPLVLLVPVVAETVLAALAVLGRNLVVWGIGFYIPGYFILESLCGCDFFYYYRLSIEVSVLFWMG